MTWMTDPESVAIFGHKQTGKTTLARQLHAESRRISIWLNDASEPVEAVPKEGHAPVSSVSGIRKRMKQGARAIEYRSRNKEQDFAQLVDWMFSVSEEFNRKVEFQIIGDEWHMVAPQTNEKRHTGRDATRKITKRGEKRNIKGVFITQDPVSTDKQWIRQTGYVVLFHNHFSQEDSLRRLNLPFTRAQNLPQYAALVVDSRGYVITPDGGVKAKTKYAK